MAAAIKRLTSINRNDGVQVAGLVQAAQWCDALVLVAATAQTYNFPTDANGNKARMFRINALGGDIWINFQGVTAVVPVANTITGAGSILFKTSLGPAFFVAPDVITSMSLISTPGTTISIEAWS
jgi:hypothetical protein